MSSQYRPEELARVFEQHDVILHALTEPQYLQDIMKQSAKILRNVRPLKKALEEAVAWSSHDDDNKEVVWLDMAVEALKENV